MPTIRKISVLVSMLFFFLAPLNAQALAAAQTAPGRFSFTISPLAGFLYGHAQEIVYKYSGRDQYLSELLWDLKPLIYFGLAADFGPSDPFQRHGFIATSSFKFGIRRRSGILEDRDWLNDQHNLVTHYSRHDVYSRNAILADLSAGYSWRLTDFLALRAFAEFSFMHFSWSGEDGYTQYPPSTPPFPPWDSTLPKRYLYGEVILYTQNWFIFAPGFSLKGRINSRFSLEGNFSYTPLIYCAARDDHLLRTDMGPEGGIFWDFPTFGHYFNGGGRFVFSPNNNLDISLSISYRYITGSRGRTYEQHTSNNIAFQTSDDGAGAGYSALDIGLSARIRVTGRFRTPPVSSEPPAPPATTVPALPPPPTPAPVPAPAVQEVYEYHVDGLILDGAITYIVRSGDTLAQIARTFYNSGIFYPIILLASGDVVTDPDRIVPGMELIVPDLQRNLNDSEARAIIRNFLLDVAAIEENRNRHQTASSIRALANSLY